MNSIFFKVKILFFKRWTNKLISIKINKPKNYKFISGNFSRLGIKLKKNIIFRAYSIVSSPNDDFLEYYIKIVNNGIFTNYLNKLKLNNYIILDKLSYGFFNFNRFNNGKNLWLLSTSTGLSPYLSMLQDNNIWYKFKKIILIHCVKYNEELNYLKKIIYFCKFYNNFKYVQILTKSSIYKKKNILYSRINILLKNRKLEKKIKIKIKKYSRFMICGNPEMIKNVKKVLFKKGFLNLFKNNGEIITEEYW